MILTNERVAELCERRRVPTIYRVHEQPDPQRIERLVEQLASLDVPTPPLPENLAPTAAGELAGEISRTVAKESARRGHGRDAYTSLVLRSLKPAYYSERNLGHAGLGSPAYAHFTSPIRRYPDLVAHRALLSAVGAGEEEPDPGQVREAAWRSSEREREATAIERDADRACASFLLGASCSRVAGARRSRARCRASSGPARSFASAASSATCTRGWCPSGSSAASAST